MNDEHIEQMGIPLGHKLKIMKRIKDSRAEKGMSVPQSRQGTSRREAKEPKAETAETPARTETARSQVTESTQKSSLKDGLYDESQNAAEF